MAYLTMRKQRLCILNCASKKTSATIKPSRISSNQWTKTRMVKSRLKSSSTSCLIQRVPLVSYPRLMRWVSRKHFPRRSWHSWKDVQQRPTRLLVVDSSQALPAHSQRSRQVQVPPNGRRFKQLPDHAQASVCHQAPYQTECVQKRYPKLARF